ncbi:MAG TPA: MBL fold metallo-hydrolase [Kofleriaceae bacterium]|nr:MBL fold metallo-hydrolase [Kofleriaceae bacterium]
MSRIAFDLEMIKLAAGLWCLRRPSYVTCSYVVETGAGVTFIDAGMSGSGRDVVEALRHIGRRPEDVDAVLLTHWHNDHSAGAYLLQSRYRVPIYGHDRERPSLATGTDRRGPRDRVRALLPDWGPLVLAKGLLGETTPWPIRLDHGVADGELVAGRFEAIETPGHTPGHLAFFDRETQTLFAGDALAVIDGRVRRMARHVTPDHARAHTSMVRLCDRAMVQLCPGHRTPLLTGVSAAMREFRAELARDRWPLLG